MKKWKTRSLSLKEMIRISNLAVKHFSLLQNDSDADYERTYAIDTQGFLYYKEMTAELQ